MSKNKNKGSIFHLNRLAKTGLVAAIAAGVSTMASAGEPIYFKHGGNLTWSLTTGYGIGMRMEKQDKKLLTDINADDGNRNFDRHSLTTHRVGALGELVYTNDNNWGGVLRGATFYDDVYHSKNDNKSSTVNHEGASNKFSSGAKYYSGGRSRFLDAYLFSDIELPNHQYLALKGGRHVVSWGEGLFYPGVNGAQGPVDVVKSSTPGTETKEVLLPNGQVSADWNIGPKFGLSAYYQYEWLQNELNPVGSFTSSSDYIGPRPDRYLLAPNFGAQYAGVNKPKSSGQYGVRAMYRPNFDWEFSLFHINYHDKNPSGIAFSPDYSSYKINYYDNIKLTGVSASTSFGDTQVSTEISYRDGAPVLVLGPGGNPTDTRGRGYQAQVSFIHTLGTMPWARGTSIVGEIVHIGATGVDSVKSGGKSYNKYRIDTADFYQSKTATAYTLQVGLEYPGIFSGWDLDVPFNFSHVIDGKTPLQGALGGGQGDRRLSVGTTFKYLNNLELDLNYVAYMGKPSFRMARDVTDRDELTFSVKYSF